MIRRAASIVLLLLAWTTLSAETGNPLIGDSSLPPGLADWKQLREDVTSGRRVVDDEGVPVDLDGTMERTTRGGKFVVRFQPDEQPPRINVLHGWELTLFAGETIVKGATVRLFGGMPLHGHGFPTRPTISEIGAGRYRLEGMKFQMAGWWQIILLITVAQSTDVAVLDVPVRSAPNWTSGEQARIASLSIEKAGPPPPDPSNRFADDPLAAELGKVLFHDTGLSGNGKVSCATCHDPASYFTKPVRLAEGIGTTRRHAPSVVGSAYGSWFYWDGRRDSAWAQALVPLEAPAEMGTTRTAILKRIAADETLRTKYGRVFGELPDPVHRDGSPPSAGPSGRPAERRAWEMMPQEDRRAVNAAFANLGKALAAYERVLLPRSSRFDRYAAALETGESRSGSILKRDEIAGLKLFISERVGCIQCHNGPLFSNGGFHNIGTVSLGVEPIDLGRQSGIAEALADPFNCLGDYSDADPDDCGELLHARRSGGLAGAFKVPSLRQVAETAPYMHDGGLATLEEVVEHYSRAPQDRLGHQELKPAVLSSRQQKQIIAFLRTLTTESND